MSPDAARSVDATALVPPIVRSLAASAAAAPATWPFDGVVLVADLVGFTPTVARLSAQGRRGRAQLVELLDHSYATIDGAIAAHGGQVVQHAGDASVAVFAGPDPADVRRRAERAAGDIVRCFGPGEHDAAGPSVRVGLGAGPGHLLVLRTGSSGIWTLLGPTPRLAAAVQAGAAPGSVTAAPGFERWSGTTDLAAVSERGGAAGADDLTAFLPRVLPRGVAALDWLAEVRPVTAMFVLIGGVAGSANSGDLAEVASSIVTLQGVLTELDSGIDALTSDDKGLYALSLFGTSVDPSPEHAPVRAIEAGRRTQAALAARGLDASIGIATGVAVVGTLGGSTGRAFTALGPAINLAARLMQLPGSDVRLDPETARLSPSATAFAVEEHDLKGVGRVPVRTARAGDVARPQVSRAVRLVGRDAELEATNELLADVAGGGTSRGLVVLGPAGVGKSVLVDAIAGRATGNGLSVVELSGDPVMAAAPLRALGAFLGRRRPELGLEPWQLDAVLAGGPSTLDTSGAAPAARLAGMVVEVLPSAPFVLVVHQAQWVDEATLDVLALALRAGASHLLVVETRSPAVDASTGLGRLLAPTPTTALALGPLQRDEVAALVADRLQVRAVPDLVVDLVHEHAAGNPFVASQLVDAAVRDGELEKVGDLVRLSTARSTHGHLTVPADVHRLLAERIDSLGPSAGLVVKVAAVLGSGFSTAEVAELHPLGLDASAVEDALVAAARQGLVDADGPSDVTSPSGGRWRFTNATIRDVACSLLTPAQQRSLHRQVAELLEGRGRRDTEVLELLAYHWTEADDASRAVPVLTEAAVRLSEVFAGPETARLAQEAMDLAAQHGLPTDAATRARWHLVLGQAFEAAGDLQRSEEELRAVLALAGVTLPGSALRLGGAVLGEAARQARHRLLGPGRRRLADREAAAVAVRALRTINMAAVQEDDYALAVAANLVALNLAEHAELRDELAASYAMAEVGAASAGLGRLADWYRRLAVAAASEQPARVAEADVYHAMRLLGDGDTVTARRLLHDVLTTFGASDATYLTDIVHAIAGYADFFAGDLEAALALYERLGADAARRGDPHTAAWGLNGEAMALVALGRDDEARRRLDLGRDLPGDALARVARAACEALVDARDATPFADAEARVRIAAGQLVRLPVGAYVLLVEFVLVAEAIRLLRARAEAEAPDRAVTLRRLHRQVLRRFAAFRLLFVAGRPSYLAARTGALALDRGWATSARRRIVQHRLERLLERSPVGVFPNGTSTSPRATQGAAGGPAAAPASCRTAPTSASS